MGQSPSIAMSSCRSLLGTDQSSTPRPRRRIRWLRQSPFGDEPKHNKRLLWLKKGQNTVAPSVEQIMTMSTESEEKQNIYNEITAGMADEEVLTPLSDSPRLRHKSVALPPRSGEEHKTFGETIQCQSHPNTSGILGKDILIEFDSDDNKDDIVEEIEGKEGIPDDNHSKTIIFIVRQRSISAESIKAKRKSQSDMFIKGTRFSTIRRSARNFIADIDEFRREISNTDTFTTNYEPISPTLLKFRTGVLTPAPSIAQMDPQEFLKLYLPFLEKGPKCFEPLLTLNFDIFDVASLPKPFDSMPLVSTTLAVLTRLGTLERLKIS